MDHIGIDVHKKESQICIEMFERAAALAPNRLDNQWRLYDLYLNNSH